MYLRSVFAVMQMRYTQQMFMFVVHSCQISGFWCFREAFLRECVILIFLFVLCFLFLRICETLCYVVGKHWNTVLQHFRLPPICIIFWCFDVLWKKMFYVLGKCKMCMFASQFRQLKFEKKKKKNACSPKCEVLLQNYLKQKVECFQ